MKRKLGWLMLILIGIALIVFGVLYGKDKHENYLETTAVISRVESREEFGADDTVETVYTYFMDYTVDGKEYKDVEVPGGSGSYKEGKEITILYDPADPSKVALPYSALANVLMYVGGGLAVIIGLAGLVISGRRG